MPSKTKKMTDGQRIAALCKDDWHHNCTTNHEWLARRIDAALKKERNAAAWDAIQIHQEGRYVDMITKYGPRPTKKGGKK